MGKPGSSRKEPAVSRVLSGTIIHLGQPSPTASSDLPGSPFGTDGATNRLLPYLVLLRAGFTLPRRVTTRAVRSYRTFSPLPAIPKDCLGGMFSVALSMGSRPPGVTWRPVRRSPDFPPPQRANARDSDCLADSYLLEPRIIPHSQDHNPGRPTSAFSTEASLCARIQPHRARD